MMTKEHILAEIRRTATSNGGVPLGVHRFFAETGVKESDWHGKFWARWGDALKETGFQPNEFTAARTSEDLLHHLAGLVRELGRFPVKARSSSKPEVIPAFQATTLSAGLAESGRSPRSWRSFAGTGARMISQNSVSWQPRPTMPETQMEFLRKPRLANWATST